MQVGGFPAVATKQERLSVCTVTVGLADDVAVEVSLVDDAVAGGDLCAMTGQAADLSGDFRALATSDVLVKKHVHALDPATPWPRSAAHFGARWQAMTGIERSAWTVLVLAAGAQPTKRVP